MKDDGYFGHAISAAVIDTRVYPGSYFATSYFDSLLKWRNYGFKCWNIFCFSGNSKTTKFGMDLIDKSRLLFIKQKMKTFANTIACLWIEF